MQLQKDWQSIVYRRKHKRTAVIYNQSTMIVRRVFARVSEKGKLELQKTYH